MKASVRSAADRLTLKCPWLRLIEHDLYGIAERIQDIEDGYFIVFDSRSGRYEVHSAYNKGSTYCFSVPYDALDARTLDYCHRTRIANTDRILAEIEKTNEALKAGRMKKFSSDIEAASYETATELKLANLKDELHSGYRRTFGGISI